MTGRVLALLGGVAAVAILSGVACPPGALPVWIVGVWLLAGLIGAGIYAQAGRP